MLKGALITSAAFLIMVNPLLKAQSKSGEIRLKDDRTIHFTQIKRPTDPMLFSKDITLRPVSDWSKLLLSAIAKVEFLELSSSEKSVIGGLNGKLPTSTRKANVTMRSGTVYKNIYLILDLMGWESADETGNFYEERIRGISFDPVLAK